MTVGLLFAAGLAGFAIGLLHFALLRRSINALLADGRHVISLTLLRFSVTGAAAWAAVQAGAGTALALLAGILAARMLVLRRGRPEP